MKTVVRPRKQIVERRKVAEVSLATVELDARTPLTATLEEVDAFVPARTVAAQPLVDLILRTRHRAKISPSIIEAAPVDMIDLIGPFVSHVEMS